MRTLKIARGGLALYLTPLFPDEPFFAGAANTPISTMIMISEMTGNYNLLVPSMLVCILAYVLCRRFNLYQKQLPSHFEAPSQIANMANAVLRQLTVGEALAAKPRGPTTTVRQDMHLRDIMKHFMESTQACLPVVDDEQHLTGVIDTRDLRRIIGAAGLDDLVIAVDIAVPAAALTLGDSLLTAIRRMVTTHHDELVVVDARDPRKVIGTLGRTDVVAAYDRSALQEVAQL